MMKMDRRTFLAAAAVARQAGAASKFIHAIGLNLYTVRAPLASQPADTYRRLAKIGVQLLEVRPANLTQHATMMSDAGLKPVHMFIESAIVTGAWDEWRGFMEKAAAKYKMPAPPPSQAARPRLEETIELAMQHGVKRIGVSMLLPGEREKAIDQINAAAERCAQAGLEFYYHNHAFECEGARGKRYVDELHRRLDPAVRLELDVFWAAAGQENPASLIGKWKGRVRSLHLKDMAPDAPRHVPEIEMPPTAFRELGAGTLDWRAILGAADAAKVEYYFIEQDFSPGNPIESVGRSVGFLRGVEY